MHERAFVLQPLLEIAPYAIPGKGGRRPAGLRKARCERIPDVQSRQSRPARPARRLQRVHDLRLVRAPEGTVAKPWWIAALASWGIALFEYLLMVPANRIGYTELSLPQLKIMQEAITLAVFVPFAILYMKQPLKLDYLWASLCIMGAVYFIFRGEDRIPPHRGRRADRRGQDQPRAAAGRAPGRRAAAGAAGENPFLARFLPGHGALRAADAAVLPVPARAQLAALAQPDMFGRPTVVDFLLDKDPLFARITLSADEMALYQKIYDAIRPQAPAPDLVVYLQAQPATLYERVRGGRRSSSAASARTTWRCSPRATRASSTATARRRC
jgi:uncharacterized protein (DUF486 family)